MAKVKTQDKRAAILQAATKIFSERGFWNTPTSLISKKAGVADGTLFLYFKTKDTLINALYLEIKMELAEVLMAQFSDKKTNREKIQHIWNQYIHWSIKNSEKYKVIEQLKVSDKILEETKNQAALSFTALLDTVNESIEKRELRNISVEYFFVIMSSLIDGTITYLSSNEKENTDSIDLGFEIFWQGVSI